jgi:hypothetical protein
LLDDGFTFSLLDDITSAGSVTLPLLEEDNSTLGSSFDPADVDDESSHATKNATMLNATKIFFISFSSTQQLNLSKV